MRYFFFILLFFVSSVRAEELFKEQNNDVLQFLPHTIKAIKDYEAHVRSTDKAKDRMNRMNNKLKEIKGYEKEARLIDKGEELIRALKAIKEWEDRIRASYADEEELIKIELESKLFPLNEFKIGKKYCLFGTKNWDDACQDAAMKFLCKDNWERNKKIALDFLKYLKKGDLNKIVDLLYTGYSAIFWEIGVMEDTLEECPDRLTIKVNEAYPKLSKADLDNIKGLMKYWKASAKGTNYRNFRLKHHPYAPKRDRFPRIFLSKDLFIDLDIDHETDLLSIRAVGYYLKFNKKDNNE